MNVVNNLDAATISKAEVKRLVNSGRWHQLGVIFEFTPVFHFGGRNFLDWRCVPQSLIDVLRPESVRVIVCKNQADTINRPKRPKRSVEDIIQVRTCSQVLYANQAGICHYCKNMVSVADWSIDHRLPYYRGGSNSFQNKIGACKSCNHTKSCLTEEEFFALQPGERMESVNAKAAVRKIIGLAEKKQLDSQPEKSQT